MCDLVRCVYVFGWRGFGLWRLSRSCRDRPALASRLAAMEHARAMVLEAKGMVKRANTLSAEADRLVAQAKNLVDYVDEVDAHQIRPPPLNTCGPHRIELLCR